METSCTVSIVEKIHEVAKQHGKSQYVEVIGRTVMKSYMTKYHKKDISSIPLQLARLIAFLRASENRPVEIKYPKDKEKTVTLDQNIIPHLEKWATAFLNNESGGVFNDVEFYKEESEDDDGFIHYCDPYTDEEISQIIELEEQAAISRADYNKTHQLARKSDKDNVYPGEILSHWYDIFENAGIFHARKKKSERGGLAEGVSAEYKLLYDCMVIIGELPEKVAYPSQKSEMVRDRIDAYEKFRNKNPDYIGEK